MSAGHVLQLAADAATALGIPIALVTYRAQHLKDRREREHGTYIALDEKYIDYLRLCMEYPRLDLYYKGLQPAPKLSEEERVQQLAMAEILITLFERAYLMYSSKSTPGARQRWGGWREYMRDWAGSSRFRELWAELGGQWDVEFTQFMNSCWTSASSERRSR